MLESYIQIVRIKTLSIVIVINRKTRLLYNTSPHLITADTYNVLSFKTAGQFFFFLEEEWELIRNGNSEYEYFIFLPIPCLFSVMPIGLHVAT